MCTVSNVIDEFSKRWEPYTYPNSIPNAFPYTNPILPPLPLPSPITSEEIEEFRRLLKKAREQDIADGNPDCELEEKKETLRKIAKALGVELPIEF